MTIIVKARSTDEPNGFVDQPVEPWRQWNGLALHESLADPANLTLTHVPSGLAILLDLDWEPDLVERCAFAIAALWDWDRSQDELEVDPDYPDIKQQVADIFAGWEHPNER